MSNKDQQGIHYHYHFYGTGAQAGQREGVDSQPGDPQSADPRAFDPRNGGFGPNPFGGGPFPGGAAPNLHAHPGADSFVKGLLVGAGAAWLLTNEAAQRTILRSAVQLWAAVQGGVEELKEKLHDAEAEFAAGAGQEAAPEPAAAPSAAPAAPPAAEAGVEPFAPAPNRPAPAAEADPAIISPRFVHSGS